MPVNDFLNPHWEDTHNDNFFAHQVFPCGLCGGLACGLVVVVYDTVCTLV